MSQTPVGSDEEVPRLHESLLGFTGCIGEALPDICSYGLTIGETYVPFNPDAEDECDEDEVMCSQAWVRVVNVELRDMSQAESFAGQSCATTLSVTLEVGIIRCVDIPEGGEAPTASDVLVAALQAMDDMNTILCAAMSCEVWDSIVAHTWLPNGPLGGQYGGTWTFTAEI